ncbi:hypothetical protein EJB05_46181, partial [Eragrostis curvula]
MPPLLLRLSACARRTIIAASRMRPSVQSVQSPPPSPMSTPCPTSPLFKIPTPPCLSSHLSLSLFSNFGGNRGISPSYSSPAAGRIPATVPLRRARRSALDVDSPFAELCPLVTSLAVARRHLLRPDAVDRELRRCHRLPPRRHLPLHEIPAKKQPPEPDQWI